MKLSLLALAPLAAAGGGARGAISETLADKLRDQGLPVAIDFLNAFKVPDLPGSWGIWSYGVTDIALWNVGADADIALSPVNGAAGAVLTLSNLKLSVQGHVYVGPIPSLSGEASTNADGTSASVAISVTAANGVPALGLGSCSADVQIADIAVNVDGLGVLDGLVEVIADHFKGYLVDAIKDAICSTGATALISNVNGFLSTYDYEWSTAGVLPAPWDGAVLDYHLAAPPPAETDPTLYADVVAEAFEEDGTKSGLAAPELPEVDMSARDASVVATAFPVNTALWTFFAQGALAYDVPRTLVPAGKWYDVDVLSTNSALYRVLMPKLHDAYPDRNLTLRIRAAGAPPTVELAAGRALVNASRVDLTFVVAPANATDDPVEAFTLTGPFSTTAAAAAYTDADGAAKVNATVAEVNLDLAAGESHFGDIGPAPSSPSTPATPFVATDADIKVTKNDA
ncbi:bactericidal permeability-increasing protein [Aureococcus anophagefferens]|nr:bactericidal permeability-increasing protein [Aureococcus anophagefferens]